MPENLTPDDPYTIDESVFLPTDPEEYKEIARGLWGANLASQDPAGGVYNALLRKGLIGPERDEVVAAAIELIENSGPFLASDGYISVKIGDDRRLRAAVQTLKARTDGPR